MTWDEALQKKPFEDFNEMIMKDILNASLAVGKKIKMNKYKCDHTPGTERTKNQHLDMICRGCLKAWMARHNRMLEILKFIAEDRDIKTIGGSPPSWIARELLKEIGEE